MSCLIRFTIFDTTLLDSLFCTNKKVLTIFLYKEKSKKVVRLLIKVKVGLQPIVSNINLPTVLKTAILPGDSFERLFIATQVGEIFYVGNGVIKTFLDIRSRIIKLGTSNGGYDERGLLRVSLSSWISL